MRTITKKGKLSAMALDLDPRADLYATSHQKLFYIR